MINGGGQERGMRSGTVPTPLVVGLGKAAEIAKVEMAEELARIKKLHDKFVTKIMDNAKDIYLNGSSVERYPGNINLSFSYIEG
jgi:cysteine desulfurase